MRKIELVNVSKIISGSVSDTRIGIVLKNKPTEAIEIINCYSVKIEGNTLIVFDNCFEEDDYSDTVIEETLFDKFKREYFEKMRENYFNPKIVKLEKRLKKAKELKSSK